MYSFTEEKFDQLTYVYCSIFAYVQSVGRVYRGPSLLLGVCSTTDGSSDFVTTIIKL